MHEADVIEHTTDDVDEWWTQLCTRQRSYAERASLVSKALSAKEDMFQSRALRKHLALLFIKNAMAANKPYRGKIDMFFYERLCSLAPEEMKELTLKMTSRL